MEAAARRDRPNGDEIGIEITLEPSPRAPAQARAGVADFRDLLDRERFADLQLVLSELVTNSAKYGPGDPIIVSVNSDGDQVHGGVTDRSEGRIELAAAPGERAESLGRWGLSLVDTVAADWGLRDRDRTVWFRLAD